MSVAVQGGVDVVSARAYALLLTSRRWGRLVLPDGLPTSPYEVLDYAAALVLHDARGLRATFRRRQRVRFLHDGVAALLDHAWGDGVLLTGYRTDVGRLADVVRDGNRRHLVIALKREMAEGTTLAFGVERAAMAGFTRDAEWLETTIDHPIRRLRPCIVFPRTRPCQRATLHHAGRVHRLPVVRRRDGRTVVRFDALEPRPHTPYTIRWRW
jgi:hypothetical protein